MQTLALSLKVHARNGILPETTVMAIIWQLSEEGVLGDSSAEELTWSTFLCYLQEPYAGS